MSDFAGVVFTAIDEAWSETANSAISVKGFPGGNTVALSLAGQREVRRTVSLIFTTRDDWIKFVLNRGNPGGTLTIDGWDSVGAVLVEASSQPPKADGSIVAKATFILT